MRTVADRNDIVIILFANLSVRPPNPALISTENEFVFSRLSTAPGQMGNGGMKRAFDICLGCLVCLAVLILFVPVLLVAMAVRLTSKGPVLYWSDRVGQIT